MCVWVLYIAIRFALEEIKDVELELEEVKKQLKQEKEDSKLLAELLINK